ncbi:MAG TPA: hypothetical protein VMI94_05180 [Bryobacteraceae bacterium]|nr:hypothetical protein [Bryobacteraceae bacterium]
MHRLALICLLPTLARPQTLPQILSRLSEEAETIYKAAPRIVSQETLTQRARKPAPRFHPRIGADALKPPPPAYQTREIVSEYSYGTLAGAPESIHEFRQVTSVDGRPIASPKAARHALALNLTSNDDRAKKRMLENFQKYGLTEAAVDFGPLLLLFTKHQLVNYTYALSGDSRIGADAVKIVSYTQTAGPARLLVFQGHRAIHQRVQGRIYARVPDGLPLRISVVESRAGGKTVLRDEATVDYTLNAQGYLAPAAVTHRAYSGGQLMVEDDFRYAAFRKFGADAAIKFDTLPVTPPPQ